MDNTARLWDVESGECLHTLLGHTAEIVSLNFDTPGRKVMTGSFDHLQKSGCQDRALHPYSGRTQW